MKTVKTFIPFALLAGILSSCGKEIPPVKEDRKAEGDITVTIRTAVDGAATKSVEADDSERKVSTLTIFAFNDKDELENYCCEKWDTARADVSASLKLSRGRKTFYAVANGNEAVGQQVLRLADLKDKISEFSDNKPENLVMVGVWSEEITEDSASVTIPMTRLAARFEIKKITKAFAAPAMQNTTMAIKRIWIANARRTVNYFKMEGQETVNSTTLSYEDFYHTIQYQQLQEDANSSSEKLLTYKPSPAIRVSQEDSTTAMAGKYLYAYPNNAPEAQSADSLDFVTKLVIKIAYNDTLNVYYTIGIPNVKSNCVYEISNLIIKRMGTEHPGEYISSSAVSFTLDARPWNEGDIKQHFVDTDGHGEFII